MSFNTKQISSTKAHSCTITRHTHTSPTLNNLQATFTLIRPAASATKPPLLYWLSGLTCTDENFVTKAGAAQHCNTHNVAIVCPDTSPRGAQIPGEDADWDLGTGAGFYVDAIAPPYNAAYHMYSYISSELPAVLRDAFPDVDVDTCSIFGHSMGGMGALVIALRNAEAYRSVSAFAPIANPSTVAWGEKCFTAYLGPDRELWKMYDPTELVKSAGKAVFEEGILVEQGSCDSFLDTHLLPMRFVEACREVGQLVKLNMAEGYDHSYYFIQTFVGKHIEFHARILHGARVS